MRCWRPLDGRREGPPMKKILIKNIDFEHKNIDVKNIENRKDQSCDIDNFLAIEKFNLIKILIERLKIFNLGCLG
jgi:hypothetical protein